MKLDFSRQIFEKYSDLKFIENPLIGGRVVAHRQTERRDETNNRFSQFCERVYQGFNTNSFLSSQPSRQSALTSSFPSPSFPNLLPEDPSSGLKYPVSEADHSPSPCFKVERICGTLPPFTLHASRAWAETRVVWVANLGQQDVLWEYNPHQLPVPRCSKRNSAVSCLQESRQWSHFVHLTRRQKMTFVCYTVRTRWCNKKQYGL